MKYSFLMPYYKRIEHFRNTMLSLHHWYGDRDDWEVIVIQDTKCVDDLRAYECSNVKVAPVARQVTNPCVAFNQARKMAQGQFLVLTNPECYHAADVLGWFDKVFAENERSYPVAACKHVHHKGLLEKYCSVLGLGEPIMWYQHSQHRNLQYHFCTAIHNQVYDEIGGFDEEYADGYCFDDDDFIDKVRCANLLCKTDDAVLVLHQSHEKSKMTAELRKKWQRNKDLYHFKYKQRRNIL